MTTEQIQSLEKTHWACACVKRDKKGPGFKIKLNPNTRAKCRACGARRENLENLLHRSDEKNLRR